MKTQYEAVIGLEVHAQLLTKSKAFSSAPVTWGAAPNSAVNEVCAGMPGVLPVLNREAVELALRAGLAFECRINRWSQFARKNYFYPDLPKGYQISQFDHPLCEGGRIEIEVDGRRRFVGITRIHMEEDTGKSSHDGDEPVSTIDLNRAGTALIEIVGEPELRTPEEASAYYKELRSVLMAIGVNDGNMAEGSLRCDANVSVRPVGQVEFGTKVEVKNINSFKFLREAIACEIDRQIAELEAGGRIWQETRYWNDARKATILMRRKEGSSDYRYFPEPDLPPLVVDGAWIERVRSSMPELPAQARARLAAAHGLSTYDASVLVAQEGFVALFDRAVALHANAKGIANQLTGPLAAAINAGQVTWSRGDGVFRTTGGTAIGADEVVAIQRLVDTSVISSTASKVVWEELIATGASPASVVDARGLRQVSDTSALEGIVDQVIAASPKEVESYRGGKTGLLGFFVGQAMKLSKGQGNPKVLQDLFRSRLDV